MKLPPGLIMQKDELKEVVEKAIGNWFEENAPANSAAIVIGTVEAAIEFFSIMDDPLRSMVAKHIVELIISHCQRWDDGRELS